MSLVDEQVDNNIDNPIGSLPNEPPPGLKILSAFPFVERSQGRLGPQQMLFNRMHDQYFFISKEMGVFDTLSGLERAPPSKRGVYGLTRIFTPLSTNDSVVFYICSFG